MLRGMRRQGCASFAIGLLAACASAPVAVPGPLPLPAATPASAPTQPPPTPTPPASAFKEALDAATKALALGDMATADKQLAAAEHAAGDDAHRAHLLARARATRFVAASDFESAAAAFLAVMPTLARHPELIDEFWAHNTMMMIREAQGDINQVDACILSVTGRGHHGDQPSAKAFARRSAATSRGRNFSGA